MMHWGFRLRGTCWLHDVGCGWGAVGGDMALGVNQAQKAGKRNQGLSMSKAELGMKLGLACP